MLFRMKMALKNLPISGWAISKKLFSLAENDRVTLLQTFVKRSKEKTLPEPAKIEVSLASSEPEESLEESLKARFPDLVVQDD